MKITASESSSAPAINTSPNNITADSGTDPQSPAAINSTDISLNQEQLPPVPESPTTPADILITQVQQAWQLIETGGPIIAVLGLLSVLATTIILLKIWQLITLRPENFSEIQQGLSLWHNSEHRLAILSLNRKKPLPGILAHAMEGIFQQQDSKILELELSRQISKFSHQLRSFLRPLEIIASLSPLLGLLGTVLGMILAFQQMEAAGSQVTPSVLSGGIWQALLTTAAGLSVAIPVAAAHSWLERKAERIHHRLSDAVTQVLTSSPAANTHSNSTAKDHAA